LTGEDLLISPADRLNQQMPPIEGDFPFRALAVLYPQSTGPLTQDHVWRLRRTLFDRGLVCIGSMRVADGKALCFLASDAIRSVAYLDAESRGHITMSELREGCGFANQLFRYACVKLYALRHSLTPAFSAWDGSRIFGLKDKTCEGF